MSSTNNTTSSIQQQQQQHEGNVLSKPPLRKPTFIKVDQLKPGTIGHNLTVKVVSSNTVLKRGRSVSLNLRNSRIAECVIGDETATIIFTARNDQGYFLLIIVIVLFFHHLAYFHFHHFQIIVLLVMETILL